MWSTECPDSSVGKESACNAGVSGLIPGSFQFLGHFNSWVRRLLGQTWRRDRLSTSVFLDSLVAQLIKNLPTMQETWVQSLGWDNPLEKGKATHSSNLAWRVPWDCIVRGVIKSWAQLSNFDFLSTDQYSCDLVLKICKVFLYHWEYC